MKKSNKNLANNNKMDDFYEVTVEDVFSSITLYELDHIAEDTTRLTRFLETSWIKYKYDILLQVYFIRSTLDHSVNALRIYLWIANNDTEMFCKMIPSIVFYGSWQDLFDLYSMSNISTLSRAMMLIYITKQIMIDYHSGSTVSNLIQYMPRERSVKDRSCGWVSILTEQMKVSRKAYRLIMKTIKEKTQSKDVIFRLIV